jgi:uncharacterized protein YdhG (YjbR/CyaY superfamily)
MASAPAELAESRRTMTQRFATIDDYVRSLPEDVQPVFEGVRRAVREAAPGADETISYQIPTLALNGRYLVHFAAWKNHLALYPTPAGDPAFEQEIAPYRAAKSTVRFPLRKPIPYDLIRRLVALRVRQREESGE